MTKNKVVLVPFPFDDLSSSKVRPAVCLSDSIGPYRHVIPAFITSQVSDAPMAADLVIDAADPDFQQAGLHVSSILQLHRLMTANTGLIRRELGSLSPRLQDEVEIRLRTLFGLADSEKPQNQDPAAEPHQTE